MEIEDQGIDVRSSWDAEVIASMLSTEASEVLDLLDPSLAWGRPPAASMLARESTEAEASSYPWCRGRRLVVRARVMAFCGGQPAGFAEAVVLQTSEEEAQAKAEADEHKASSSSSGADEGHRRACRICLEAASSSEDLQLLDSVCACRGGLRYICTDCLVLQFEGERKFDKLSAARCGLCKQLFTGKALEILSKHFSSEIERKKEEKPKASAAENFEILKSQIVSATQLWQQGKLSEAGKLFRETIAGLEKTGHEGHLHSARHNLSLVLHAQGRYQDAYREVKLARKGLARLYGGQHPLVLKSYHNEAMCANSAGLKDEAQQLYRDTLLRREKVLGPEHVDTLKTRCNWGLCLRRCGQLDECEAPATGCHPQDVLRQALSSLERVLGRRHFLSLTVMQNLSLVLATRRSSEVEVDSAKGAAAEVLAQEAVQGKHLAIGPLHQDTLEGRRDLGTVLSMLGRRSEAEEAWRQALAGSQEVLGFDHPLTLGMLGQLNKSLMEHDEAAAQQLMAEHSSGKVVSGTVAPKQPQWWGPKVVVVLAVFTLPDWRCRGVGRALLGNMQRIAKDLRAGLEVARPPSGNAGDAGSSALPFLQRCGFQAESDSEVMTLKM